MSHKNLVPTTLPLHPFCKDYLITNLHIIQSRHKLNLIQVFSTNLSLLQRNKTILNSLLEVLWKKAFLQNFKMLEKHHFAMKNLQK